MSDEVRLKTGIWIRAWLRRWSSLGLAGVVARKGDEDAGAVVLKIFRTRNHVEVFTQARDGSGALIWLRGCGNKPVDETFADQAIARWVADDRDLWIVELECPESKVSALEAMMRE